MDLTAFPRRKRQTKIVATLGPSSSSRAEIFALFEAGADVFRLNFSHGTEEAHRARAKIIREIEAETGRPIAILADLQGPKLRVGCFEGGRVQLEKGQSFRLDRSPVLGTPARVCLPHPEIFAALTSGAFLLLDDGKLRLQADYVGADFIETTVLTSGTLSDHKGVNVPGTILPLSPLTAKDRADLVVALDLGADWVALSFVQRPEDLIEARALIGTRAALMAKLEKPSAVESLDAILAVCDGVMVARGDLGVEMPPEDVPRLQKRIVRAARREGKPVIVATQMLESMIQSATPTRAEASDVATAVYDGADAVMLSAETASGAFPVEAVAIMDRIAQHTQADLADSSGPVALYPELQPTASDAISAAALQVAETTRASVIATYTTSGLTTLRAARGRPRLPILGLTSQVGTARQLALSFGVHAALTGELEGFAAMVQRAVRIAARDGFARPGDKMVITAGVPFGVAGNTNILRIAVVKETDMPD